jgi:hypothetical protein
MRPAWREARCVGLGLPNRALVPKFVAPYKTAGPETLPDPGPTGVETRAQFVIGAGSSEEEPKLTPKRAHQMDTDWYLPRSVSWGTS